MPEKIHGCRTTFHAYPDMYDQWDRSSQLQMNAYAITITEMPSFSTIMTFDG